MHKILLGLKMAWVGAIALVSGFFGHNLLGTATVTPGNSYPTSSYAFNDNDIINAGDLNLITTFLGTRSSTDPLSISYRLASSSSVDPGHQHTSSSIQGYGNFTNATATANIGSVTAKFSGQVDASSSVNVQGVLDSRGGFTFANATGTGNLQAATLNTTGLASFAIASTTQLRSASTTLNGSTTIPALLNVILATNGSGAIVATTTSGGGSSNAFGGTGSDGALNFTSGSTTIDLGGALEVTKNYSSITIGGTGELVFSNPNASGTLIVLKSTGACNVTSTAGPAIELRNIGSAGGASPASFGGSDNSNGDGGGGGASLIKNGTDGTGTTGVTAAGNNGASWGSTIVSQFTNATAGQVGAVGKAGLTNVSSSPAFMALLRSGSAGLVPGAGGGSGGPSRDGTGGAGGRGAGALYMECTGAINFTSTIDGSGTVGGNGVSGSFATNGPGGGGGGGAVKLISQSTSSVFTGTIKVPGGQGGTSPQAFVGGIGGDGVSSTVIYVGI